MALGGLSSVLRKRQALVAGRCEDVCLTGLALAAKGTVIAIIMRFTAQNESNSHSKTSIFRLMFSACVNN